MMYFLLGVCNECRMCAFSSGQSRWQPEKLTQRVEMPDEKDEDIVSYSHL